MEKLAGDALLFFGVAVLNALQSWRQRKHIDLRTNELESEVAKVQNGWRSTAEELHHEQTQRIVGLESHVLELEKQVASLTTWLNQKIVP